MYSEEKKRSQYNGERRDYGEGQFKGKLQTIWKDLEILDLLRYKISRYKIPKLYT